MTKAELLEAAKTLFTELVEGENANEVADIMGWDDETFAKVQKAMLAGKSGEIRSKPAEHVYVEYLIEQGRNVHDLSGLIKNLDQKSQYNALVGAIRLRSDIVDKMLERGFEFGMVKRKEQGGGGLLGGGNTFNIIAGVKVGEMTNPQLRDAIGTQLKELEVFIDKFGDATKITDLIPGPLHYGKALVSLPGPETEAEEAEPRPKPKLTQVVDK